MLTFLPITSAELYPKIRSAAGLNASIVPSDAIVMIPSTTVLRIARIRLSLSPKGPSPTPCSVTAGRLYDRPDRFAGGRTDRDRDYFAIASA
jgi:hypothetical protein